MPTRALHPAFATLIATLALAPCVLAQPSTSDLNTQLTTAKQQLAAPALAPAQRLDLLTRCDELERRLIALAPADDRVPSWLADRAAAALDLAGLDSGGGADIIVLFGVPTRSELKSIRARATEALDLTKRAESAAALAVARLEAQLVGGQARADAVEQSLHILIDVEQGQRIPYLKALATLLLGAASTDEPARETAQSAAKLLGALPPPNPPTGPLAESRTLSLAAALIHASIGLGDRATDALKAAATQLEPIARAYKPGAPESSSSALKARLALIRAGAPVPTRPRATNPAAERELDALETESRAASFLDRAAREPAGRNLLLSSAIRELLSVADAAPADKPELKEALRVRAYDKIAAAIPSTVPIEKLPPEAALARAIARIRDSASGAADPISRDDAALMLTKLAAREDASPALRAQARWERAVIIAAAADPLTELDALALIVRSDADSEKAVPAARRIADLFARRDPSASDPLAALPEQWSPRLPALRDAIALLLRRDTTQLDRWRQDGARLVSRELTSPFLDAPALDRALDLAAAVVGSGPSPAASTITDTLWRTLDARRTPAADAANGTSPAIAKLEWDRVIPFATRALAWSRTHDPAREPGYTLLLGEALTGSGNPEGRAMLDGLNGGPVDRPDAPLWPRYKLALARAQRAASQHAEALATFREVADHFEGAPGSSKRDPAYWAAWCEMIAIQHSQNENGARSPDIRVQIKRLELLDPTLGGPPWSDRIKQVRLAIGE